MSMIYGGNSITFPDGTTQNTVALPGMRNRIINGAMMIDQRNAGASVTPANGDFVVDRWKFGLTQSSKLTSQQSTAAPAGHKNSIIVTSSSAYSVASGDAFVLNHRIEGYNIADLNWGTVNAATVTLSFWVRSSLTGTFGGAIKSNSYDQNYPFSYTVSVANTWEQKTITISGPTSGTWETGNLIGIQISFGLGVGSTYSGTAGSWSASNYFSATGATSVVGTNGATFYITGVQLEKGSTATRFDYRPYGTELALCQRYFINFINGTSENGPYVNVYGSYANAASTTGLFTVSLPVTMRASPTMTKIGTWTVSNTTAQPVLGGSHPNSFQTTITSAAAGAFQGVCSGAGTGWSADAEL